MEKSAGEEMSEIQEFFDGRSVFITGASGFVGGILLEQLLRLCPGIDQIFILLREKRGKYPQERRDQLLDRPTFWKLKKDTPEVLQKIHVISGQMTEYDLGISPEDLEKLRENVSIVFHCAASISFHKDFRFMATNNILGTYNVISLCTKLPKIAAYVHTSTAFANGKAEKVKEEVILCPVPVDKIIEAIKSQDDTFLCALEKEHGKNWYNAYTFSKSLAENVVLQKASDFPTAVVRPSIVAQVWKGSLPGYIEAGASFSDGLYGIMTGFVQLVLIDPNKRVDTVPCDIVANTLIATAWNIASKRVDGPLVLNCISSNTVILTFGQFYKEFLDRRYSAFCPNTFRTPDISYVTSIPVFLLLSFFYHRLFFLITDVVIRLCGGKLRTTKFCDVLDKQSVSVAPFSLRNFYFDTTNFDKLKTLLNKRDSEIFSIDLSGYNFRFMAENISVNRAFQLKNEDMEYRLHQAVMADRLAMMTLLYKCALLLILFTLASLLLKIIFRSLI